MVVYSTTGKETEPAGNNGDVQFNTNGAFDATSTFNFDGNNLNLGNGSASNAYKLSSFSLVSYDAFEGNFHIGDLGTTIPVIIDHNSLNVASFANTGIGLNAYVNFNPDGSDQAYLYFNQTNVPAQGVFVSHNDGVSKYYMDFGASYYGAEPYLRIMQGNWGPNPIISFDIGGGLINMPMLPTSSAGLPSGTLWKDTTGGLNILKVV